MKQISAVLIGAGGRGMDAYAPYALQNPQELKFVAVAEPNEKRRARFQVKHNIPDEMCFSLDHELLAQPRLADVALVCTQDRQHFTPTVKALEAGYHILLEKPMSPDPLECIQIAEAVEQYQRICSVCHVLRYTEFFVILKRLLDQCRIGQLISVQYNENVAYWHQALSFVRGPWNNAETSSPMILSKSCHDMDILLWLVGADCLSVSSFGSLTHFKAENAPPGSPEICQDGCPVQDECPWYAPAFYLHSEHGEGSMRWAMGVDVDADMETKLAALRKSKHGRCVYRCDNNVVDHQVVSMEFANEVTAVFTMSAFTYDCSRTIKLMGTKGEIGGDLHHQVIKVKDFLTGTVEKIDLSAEITANRYGHDGGDYRLMRDFVKLVREDAADQVSTSAAISAQGHLMAFAAERARLLKTVIDIEHYTKEVKASPKQEIS